MTHLIDKAALVAKIERKIDVINQFGKIASYEVGLVDAYKIVLSFLDTLEVKELDFEKMWEEYFKYRGDIATVNVKHLAKHFFELGMSVSNKAQKGERV